MLHTVYIQNLQKHAVTIVITYNVLLIKALKAIAILTFWSSLFCRLSFFICYRPYFFVYIIKFIIEINTVMKLAHK